MVRIEKGIEGEIERKGKNKRSGNGKSLVGIYAPHQVMSPRGNPNSLKWIR